MVTFTPRRGFRGACNQKSPGRDLRLRDFPHARPALRHWVYQVQVQSGSLPDYAKLYALPTFTLTSSVVWLRVRRMAKRICADVSNAGGQASFERYEAQKCQYCKRWVIGAEAETMRKNLEWQRMSPWEDMPRCGPACEELCALTASQSA